MLIDLSIYSNLTSQNKGLFNDIITSPINGNNFRLRRHTNPMVNRWLVTDNLDYNIYNICIHGIKTYGDDHIVNIEKVMSELLNRDFNSILIAGLGIGLIPYICNNAGIETDVVEISSELINMIEPLGYLNGVNIINENIFTYTPTKQYDVILLHKWTCDCEQNFQTELNTLITKYNQYLNTNGIIYVPINKNGQKVFPKS